MAQKSDSLLDKMKRSSTGYVGRDFKTVLEGHGFVLREGNKHTVYNHPCHRDLIMSVPRGRKEAKPWVARDVVKLIEKLSQREKICQELSA